MALNAMKVEKTQRRSTQPDLEVDSYPARLVQLIDLGVHPVSKWDEASSKYVVDETRPPRNLLLYTYELVDEFMKDENGVPNTEKPRWFSEQLYLYDLGNDKATSTKRYNAFDSDNVNNGDWAMQVGKPCMLVIAPTKSGKVKIGSVAKPMRGYNVAELKNPPKIFDMDAPNLEVFQSLPEWMQTKIKESIKYAGGPLEALITGKPAKAAAPVQEPNIPEVNEGEDMPW